MTHIDKVFDGKDDFPSFHLDNGVILVFSKFSFNCTNGQYSGLWRYGNKRSGLETKPMSIVFQARPTFQISFILHTQTNTSLNVLNAS